MFFFSLLFTNDDQRNRRQELQRFTKSCTISTTTGRLYDSLTLAFDATTSDWYEVARNVRNMPIFAFTDGDTTPDIYGVETALASNSTSTTITNFDNARDGQKFTIIFTNGNTTIASNTVIRLASGSNFTGSQYDTLTLVYSSSTGDFHEIGRSVNA